MAKFLTSIAFMASCLIALAAEQRTMSVSLANPIRKVVNLLRSMDGKIKDEAEKEQEMFDKYMCYCSTTGSQLATSIAAAETRIPALTSSIEGSKAQLEQLKEDLTKAQEERTAAKETIAQAKAIREKTAAAFAAQDAEDKANIAAITKAVNALTKGTQAAFLQSTAAEQLQKLIVNSEDMPEEDKENVLAFFTTSTSASPSVKAGEIIGILKQMRDEMTKANEVATAAEESSIADHVSLVESKKQELNSLTKSIEIKLQRRGELEVKLQELKHDLEDTEEVLEKDKKFLADLEASCSLKKKEWGEIQLVRQEELAAIADTIKILNDDDSLELFKKTLPSSAASFVQVQSTSLSKRVRALGALGKAHRRASRGTRSLMAFVSLALRGKKIGFEKVQGMIDRMILSLKKEQKDDSDKKAYCQAEFELAEDKKEAQERAISDTETAIAKSKEAVATMSEEIASMSSSIQALDQAVKEATELRKAEHATYEELVANNNAAKEVLGFAKNRLQKFYNPKLYKAPPKRELSEMDRITVAQGGTLAPTPPPGGIAGTGITAFMQVSASTSDMAVPPPPPEAVGAYKRKSEESAGALAMMDLLANDLDKELTVAGAEEKDAQADYESMLEDSKSKRKTSAKALAAKESAKADLEGELQAHSDDKTSGIKELSTLIEYIGSLHSECDWLVKNFDVREAARENEVDSLKKAKAVLSGADFSFLQTKSQNFLGRDA